MPVYHGPRIARVLLLSSLQEGIIFLQICFQMISNLLRFKMTSEENKIDYGLMIGENAPVINIKDVKGDPFDFKNTLSQNEGLLIDFFRGTF